MLQPKSLRSILAVIAATVLLGTMAMGCSEGEQPSPESSAPSQSGMSDPAGTTDESESTESGDGISTGTSTGVATGNGTRPATGKKTTGTSTAATKKTTGTSTGGTVTPPKVKDMKGRVFKFGAGWSEDVEGSGTRADCYWETKRYIEKTYNCKIEHHTLIGDDLVALKTSILAGAPNCDWFNVAENMFQLTKDKCLYPLNKLSSLNLNDPKWSKVVREYSTVDGNVYGVRENTVEFRTLLLYNKSLIKGSDDLITLQKKDALTWDKLFDIAKKVTKGDVYGICGSMDINDLVTAMISANGGKAVTRGKGLDFTYTFDSVNTRNALKTVQEMVAAQVVLPTSGMTYLYAQNQFAKGKLGMFIADEWQVDFVCNKAKFDVGCVLLPAGPDASKPLVDQSLTSMSSIAATAENPEDVATIIDAMASYTPSKEVGWRETWSDRFNDSGSVDTIAEYVRRIETGDYYMDYRPVIAGDIYSNGVYDLLGRVANGAETPQTFLESTKQIFQKAINDFKK